jgi:hypothetical protein
MKDLKFKWTISPLYVTDFDQALRNLDKVPEQCIATRLCLIHEKFHMMMIEGVVLGHYVSTDGIKVDPTKIEVILHLPTPCTQTEVHSFLGCPVGLLRGGGESVIT